MKYTKDNPKLVHDVFNFRGMRTFTGVVKNKYNNTAYYLNGRFYREDGPAIEYGHFSKSWYLNDECYGENDDFTNESWIRFVELQVLK